MISRIAFDLPYEDCPKCMSFDPTVKRDNFTIGDDLKIHYNTRFYCKGETFCRRRIMEDMKDE